MIVVMQGTSEAQSRNPRPDIPSPFQWHGAGRDGTERSGASMLKARGFRSSVSLVDFSASHDKGDEDIVGSHSKVHVVMHFRASVVTSIA